MVNFEVTAVRLNKIAALLNFWSIINAGHCDQAYSRMSYLNPQDSSLFSLSD